MERERKVERLKAIVEPPSTKVTVKNIQEDAGPVPPTAAEQLLAERANMPRAYAGMTGGTRTPKPETRNSKPETRN